MFVLKENALGDAGIPDRYLEPYIKSPGELNRIEFENTFRHKIFVCRDAIDEVDDSTREWIEKFRHATNKNESKTIQEACKEHRPYWYSMQPKHAHIITATNPYDRFFFTFSQKPFAIDQRLIAMQVHEGYDVELIAALLNSVLTYLLLEIRGTSRHLGVLDLNANFLKGLRALNPDLLAAEQRQRILQAFAPLKHRTIGKIWEELEREDRRTFDETVFECYGFTRQSLESVYSLLGKIVRARISMHEK